MSTDTQTPSELALAFEPAGYEQIPEKTVLTRLNYYDGKFLRADSLRLEQDYLRRLAELGARAGGSGLLYGFDVFLGTDEQLTIGGGLGYDARPRAVPPERVRRRPPEAHRHHAADGPAGVRVGRVGRLRDLRARLDEDAAGGHERRRVLSRHGRACGRGVR